MPPQLRWEAVLPSKQQTGISQQTIHRSVRPVDKARKSAFDAQSPVPAFGEKYFSNLPSTPSNSFASAGESFFWVIFGQVLAYSVFTSSHFSSPGSVSGLIASAGHSGSHTPQSMHSSGRMTSMFSPS